MVVSGTAIALVGPMAPPSRSTYDEPTVMWRMERAVGLRAHAIIGVRADRAWLIWCINDRPMGIREFADWASAIQWSEQLKRQNWSVGWRLTSDGEAR